MRACRRLAFTLPHGHCCDRIVCCPCPLCSAGGALPPSLPLGSPTTSLDRWVPSAAAGEGAQRGPSRPNLAAAMRLALGSQESCSLGGRPAAGQQPPEAAGAAGTFGGPTPAPSPAVGVGLAPLVASAVPTDAQLEARLEQLRLGWAAQAAAVAADWQRGWDGAPGGAPAGEAAGAQEDIGQYLVD